MNFYYYSNKYIIELYKTKYGKMRQKIYLYYKINVTLEAINFF